MESYKCNIIRKIWREGGEVLKTKVYEKLSEQEAFEHEKTLIAAYGRQYLANKTDGGEGQSGCCHTPILNGTPTVGEYRAIAVLNKAVLALKANLHRRTVARAEKGKPIERAKALVLAQTLSECVGKTLSIEDLGITIYSHGSYDN